jgi:signal transduction histidine kinase
MLSTLIDDDMETVYIANTDETIPDYTTVIVHELRNPLTSIKLSAAIIAAMAKDDDIKKFVDIISKSAQRLDDLINELLKPAARNRDFKETISLHNLLDEAIHLAEDRLLLKEIEVTKEYDPRDIEISVNKAQLKIAFTNIIINAIDAMEPKTGKLRLGTKSTSNNCILYIEDNGCGIKPENLNEIFKPYFTDKPDGLGLGLSATKKILGSNNIEIIVGSKPGAGTVFTLLFGRSSADAAVEPVHFDGLITLQPATFG